MDRTRKQEILRVFESCLDLEPDERGAFLQRTCRDDREVGDEVLRLLSLELKAGDFLAPAERAAGSGPPVAGPATPLVARGGTTASFIESSREALERLPQRIGPYRLERVLGEGGMGVVYLAEQEEPVRRTVALKLIRPGMDTREVVARFEAERQALALMDHPAIAHVYEAGAAPDGRPYFVMEYVRGVPVDKYCDTEKLEIRERLAIFIEICRGVAHAHRQGIIHRDIKPSNILVSRGEDVPVVKIIDFGIAKATEQKLTEKTLYTEVGRAIGTPAYMSPEQTHLTSEGMDHRTDIYSLGVLLYELLTGELPLDWSSLSKAAFDEILRRVRDEEPATPSTRLARLSEKRLREVAACRSVSPAELVREIRDDLGWITMKAMEKEAARRYATASDLAHDVGRYLSGDPVLAGPPSGTYLLRKYARKHRGFLTAVGAVVFVLLLGLAGTIRFATQSHERLTSVERLSDAKRLENIEAAATKLWPATPQTIDALEGWREEAQPLVDRLDVHRSSLELLRQRALPRDGDQEDQASWRFAATEDQWRHDNLTDLVDRLELFGGDDPHTSAVRSVRDRLEFARRIERLSLEEHDKEWREATASIADPGACPAYGGLRLRPQLGLVPLGRDPRSGLWEFAHLQTGSPARRADDGFLEITEATGIVFVLIPGGTFWMGAENLGVKGAQDATGFRVAEVTKGSVAEHIAFAAQDVIISVNGRQLGARYSLALAQRELEPGTEVEFGIKRGGETKSLKWMCDHHLDPQAEKDESPRREVTLEPFFLSKYEMTQTQWKRFRGRNPSTYLPGKSKLIEDVVEPTNPVESVHWEACRETVWRLGLRLPREAEWEYAARAGTTTVWWSGNTLDTLEGCTNIADRSLAERNPSFKAQCENWLDDGHHVHAPVGSYRPNAFGLHDVAGNVWEWCHDLFKDTGFRVARGGGWGFNGVFCRSGDRGAFTPLQARRDLGLRPARDVDDS